MIYFQSISSLFKQFWSFLAEAISRYGKENITLYKSKFNPMYFAVTKHKEPSIMKIICAGKEEKVVIFFF